MKEESRRIRPPMGGRGPGHGMGIPVEKPKDFKGTFIRLFAYIRPYLGRIFIVLIAAIISTAFTIISPKVLGYAITRIFGNITNKQNDFLNQADFNYIKNILFILAGLYIVSSLFNYIQQYIMAKTTQEIVFDIREEVKEKLNHLPLKYFDNQTHGEVLSRVTNDVDNISSTLQQSITQTITSGITLIGVIIMMLTISPIMTLIIVATLPLYYLVTKYIVRRSQKFFSLQQKKIGELNGHIEEMYTGHEIIKAFNREENSLEKFEGINNQLYKSSHKALFISGAIMPSMIFIGNLAYVMVCVVGGILVTKRFITIGDIQAFIQYARQFTQPISQTANISNIIQSTIASAERIFEVLDEEEEISEPITKRFIQNPKGNVRFENVSFGYEKDVPVIRNMSIDVKKGQTIAIVGPTGAGKTTLVNLLMRFYEIDSGRILVDGIDIRDLSRGHLRSMFGMVLQDTWLLNGTIRENISYCCDNATEEKVIKAAKISYVDHFVRTLPDGYDTIINEEATNISHGQKQLLTIARAILANPIILILDEATSSVDTRTEVLIQRAMKSLMKGRTSFVIAHRLSTIKNADLILVINEGEVIEQGNHKELINKKGFYEKLYNTQFADFIS
ncbi:MAG TPA: ABC transporter ATP-binding protein [Eubacteriaceae bacterium]|nr:ABC transporter ATP-binding protein [Eubacteriaceae bacterium]